MEKIAIAAAAIVTSLGLSAWAQSPVPRDAVAQLNDDVRSGATRLTFERGPGYLRSVLQALRIPAESQSVVFSETSRQRDHIAFRSPRALYFNDSTALGAVAGGDALEVIVQDPALGLRFYTLAQQPQDVPQFVRAQDCLQCHLLPDTGGVGGLLMLSVLPLADQDFTRSSQGGLARLTTQKEGVPGWAVDDRTPIADRWGGWFVTGPRVPSVHLGNVPVRHVPRSFVREPKAPRVATLSGRTNTPLLTPHSDIVALLVLSHQVRVTNLLNLLRWHVRRAADGASLTASEPLAAAVREAVDGLLFAGEAALPEAVRGGSGFAERFAAGGARDGRGRSLRDLDLTSRLFRYRCSYLIDSPVFTGLPADARALIYRELWRRLSNADGTAALPLAERQAIVDILRDTKTDVPVYLQSVTR